MEKKFTKFELARMKRTAQNLNQYLTKKHKLVAKQMEIEAELAELNQLIELTDAPTKAMTGGFGTEDIIKKVVNEGFDYQIALKVLESLDFSYEVYNEKTILSKETDKLYKRLSKKYSGTELRNRMYYSLISKGFSSETVYAILNEKEWSRE